MMGIRDQKTARISRVFFYCYQDSTVSQICTIEGSQQWRFITIKSHFFPLNATYQGFEQSAAYSNIFLQIQKVNHHTDECV